MQSQDVSRALFAWGARFTENGVQLPLGDEGLWFGMLSEEIQSVRRR